MPQGAVVTLGGVGLVQLFWEDGVVGGGGSGGSGSGGGGGSGAPGGRTRSKSSCNVAANNVVIRLNVTEEDVCMSGSVNYAKEFLNYSPELTLPHAYTADDQFSVMMQELGAADLTGSSPAEAGGSAAAMSDDPASASASEAQQQQELRDARRPTTAAATAADAEELSKQREDALAPAEPPGYAGGYNRRAVTLLRDMEERSRNGEWPSGTTTLCFWCCHQFPGAPIGLPVKAFADRDGFHTIGCFCSVPCAAAHNLESNESNDTVFERHSMLRTLSRLLGQSGDFRAAPPRTALTVFGGFMGISEFRDSCKQDAVYLQNLPPMRSLSQQIEEVEEQFVGSGFSFAAVSRSRPESRDASGGGLVLRRKKPLLDANRTLDKSMNLTIHTTA
jgi:hypothetical protein